MAKPKRPRVGIALDMTPMVDIGFLLVIFFMSTYHARPPETIGVDLPMSRSPFKVPESDVMIVTMVTPDRAVAIAESINPSALLRAVSQYQMPVSEGGQGMSRARAIERAVHETKLIQKIEQAVMEAATFTPEQRKARADSLLCWWNLGRESSLPCQFDMVGILIAQERVRNPRLRLVMKADKNVESGLVLRMMEMLQDPRVNMLRFSMMTMLEETGSLIFVKQGKGG